MQENAFDAGLFSRVQMKERIMQDGRSPSIDVNDHSVKQDD